MQKFTANLDDILFPVDSQFAIKKCQAFLTFALNKSLPETMATELSEKETLIRVIEAKTDKNHRIKKLTCYKDLSIILLLCPWVRPSVRNPNLFKLNFSTEKKTTSFVCYRPPSS